VKKLKERKLNTQVHKWYWENFEKLTGFENNRLVDHTRKHKLKPEITHKMKKVINSIKKVTVHLNILGLLFIVACGSDNPTGNNNPPSNETAIISFDTLLVRGISSVVDSLHSEILTKAVRIDFKVETNALNTDIPSIGYKYGYWQSLTDSLNGEHSFTVSRDTSKTTDVLLQLFLSADTSKYLRVVNAKVYKVN